MFWIALKAIGIIVAYLLFAWFIMVVILNGGVVETYHDIRRYLKKLKDDFLAPSS